VFPAEGAEDLNPVVHVTCVAVTVPTTHSI